MALLRPLAAASAALLCAALSACSFNYGQGEAEKLAEDVPNSVQINFEQTIVDKGSVIFRLRAAKAESYASAKQTRLEGVSFAEYDPATGSVITAGQAGSAVYHDDTKNAEISGGISFSSARNRAKLKGDYLSWDDGRKVLEGSSGEQVTVTRDDGSRVTGRGFSADARRKSFRFSGRTYGTIVVQDAEKGE